MQLTELPSSKRWPWYLWPLIPPVFVATVVFVAIPLAALALVSIPYFWLYPERHAHQADVEGTERERQRLRRWRAAYQRISSAGRVRHALRRSSRRGR
jgi:hypothetical protein